MSTSSIPSTRKAGLALLVLFLLGFLVVVGISWGFQRLIDDLDHALSNQRARLFIGEQIVNTINNTERIFLNLVPATDEAVYKRLQADINRTTSQLEEQLRVLQHGGVVRQELALNLYGADEMVREAHYAPEPGRGAMDMEVIEIAPFVDRTRAMADEILGSLRERDRCLAEQNSCLAGAQAVVQSHYKLLPAYFFRLSENANRQFYESSGELKRLEAELALKHTSLRQIQLGSVVLVIVSVLGIGFVFTRRINHSQAELEHALVRAEQASQAKSRFLASMSHEIRTPMNGILGLSQLLQDPAVDDTQRQAYIGQLQQSSQGLLGLLSDMLDLSKSETGTLALHLQSAAPCRVLEETVALFAQQAREKGLELRCHCAVAADAQWMLDAARLRQMLMCLMGNAVKFTAQGHVALAVSAKDADDGTNLLEFSVSDSGPGIPADKQAALFQSFSRVDDSSTTQHDGAGLGLALVQQLTLRMGGTVGVESKPGAGARFWFSIPAQRSNEAAAAPAVPAANHAQPSQLAAAASVSPVAAPASSEAAPLGKLAGSVLVAEDHPVNQMLIKTLLGQLGVQVQMVDNGAKAVHAYTENPAFDCILMDVRMPEMDGLEATRAIRQWEQAQPGRHCPIMAVTANAYEEDRAACLDAGMDDFLPKPIVRGDLHRKLAQWLSPA